MPLQLPEFPEEDLHEGARSLLLTQGTFVAKSASVSSAEIWKCGVNQKSEHEGYCFSYEDRVLGYLITHPLYLPKVAGIEAVRGWLDPRLRGIGAFQELMQYSAGTKSLISDLEGMTDAAHSSWLSAQKFKKLYLHMYTGEQAEAHESTQEKYFSKQEEAKSWLLVLSCFSS